MSETNSLPSSENRNESDAAQDHNLLCRLGFHRWQMFGPWREGDQWRAMWARCACGASKHLVPLGGRYPRMVFGRGR